MKLVIKNDRFAAMHNELKNKYIKATKKNSINHKEFIAIVKRLQNNGWKNSGLDFFGECIIEDVFYLLTSVINEKENREITNQILNVFDKYIKNLNDIVIIYGPYFNMIHN